MVRVESGLEEVKQELKHGFEVMKQSLLVEMTRFMGKDIDEGCARVQSFGNSEGTESFFVKYSSSGERQVGRVSFIGEAIRASGF